MSEQYLGFTFIEMIQPNPEDGVVEYTIESGSGTPLGTITRHTYDPNAAPEWGVVLIDRPSIIAWFTTRALAIEYLKEHTA